jgi:hypothetical protein
METALSFLLYAIGAYFALAAGLVLLVMVIFVLVAVVGGFTRR